MVHDLAGVRGATPITREDTDMVLSGYDMLAVVLALTASNLTLAYLLHRVYTLKESRNAWRKAYYDKGNE